jgi:hypothetical protein
LSSAIFISSFYSEKVLKTFSRISGNKAENAPLAPFSACLAKKRQMITHPAPLLFPYAWHFTLAA